MKKDNNLYKLKEWYDNKETSSIDLTEDQFYELLDFLNFELKLHKLKNGIKVYYLKDLQGVNLGNIEQDIFYCEYEKIYGLDNIKKQDKNNWIHIKDLIINRLEVYFYDYFVRDGLYP
jgi:hypothetical protein